MIGKKPRTILSEHQQNEYEYEQHECEHKYEQYEHEREYEHENESVMTRGLLMLPIYRKPQQNKYI